MFISCFVPRRMVILLLEMSSHRFTVLCKKCGRKGESEYEYVIEGRREGGREGGRGRERGRMKEYWGGGERTNRAEDENEWRE